MIATSRMVKASRMGGKPSRMGGKPAAGGKASRYGSKITSSKRTADEEDELKDSFLAQLYVLANVTQGEEAQIEQMLSGFDLWSIDLQPALDMVESNALAVIFSRCMMCHNLIPELKLDFELLFNACQHVQLASHPHVQFHSPAHACVMLHAVHYFLLHDLDRMVDSFEMFALFFSCIAVHYAHPGLTNEFLVKIRHPRALRYNDVAVLENYNLSRITMLLSDPECNFMLQMEPFHVDAFRALIIKVILKMDMSQHFEQLSRLQTKLASDKYPTSETWMDLITKHNRLPKAEEAEDRVILLFTALRCADLAWACHTQPVFGRWAEKFTEELFCQGDIEKQVGVPISPFSDRDLVQPPKAQLAFLHVIVAPIYTQFIFTLREAEKGKHGVQKEIVDKLEKEVIDEGVEANRQALHNKVLQGAR
jgi:hypothetical protein